MLKKKKSHFFPPDYTDKERNSELTFSHLLSIALFADSFLSLGGSWPVAFLLHLTDQGSLLKCQLG